MKEKTIFIGSTKPETYDRRPLPITLDVSLEEKSGMEHFKTTITTITPPALRLSISGSIGSHAGGQINDTLKDLMNKDALDYRPGWNADRLTALLRIWERWHLNYMKPGCIHQSTAETRKELTLVKVSVHPWKIRDEETRRKMERLLKNYTEKGRIPTSEGIFPLDYLILDCFKAAKNGEVYQPKTEGEKSYFEHGVIEIKTEKKAAGWVKPNEHPEGMLTRPCPQCGYAYGSAWLFDALPPEVTDFIKALDNSTPEDLEEADAGNVKGFVKRHGIKIDVDKAEENKNAPDWKDANHYKITFHYQGRRMSTYFSQGTGIEHKPTAADVLNCLAMDARTLQDYPDPLEWAESLGLETGKKTAKAFKSTTKNTEALDRLLGPALMQELLEETETL